MDHTNIIAEVEAFAKKAGLSASTVCVRATGNSRLIGRIQRRADQTENDIARLRAYMAENAVTNEASA